MSEPIVRCPIHGIPDCSPLLNGCSFPNQIHRLPDNNSTTDNRREAIVYVLDINDSLSTETLSDDSRREHFVAKTHDALKALGVTGQEIKEAYCDEG